MCRYSLSSHFHCFSLQAFSFTFVIVRIIMEFHLKVCYIIIIVAFIGLISSGMWDQRHSMYRSLHVATNRDRQKSPLTQGTTESLCGNSISNKVNLSGCLSKVCLDSGDEMVEWVTLFGRNYRKARLPIFSLFLGTDTVICVLFLLNGVLWMYRFYNYIIVKNISFLRNEIVSVLVFSVGMWTWWWYPVTYPGASVLADGLSVMGQ